MTRAFLIFKRLTLLVMGFALCILFFQNCSKLKSSTSSSSSHNHSHGAPLDSTYEAVAATYCPSNVFATCNVLGDGSDVRGGRAPAYAKMPPIIPSNFDVSKWLASTSAYPNPENGESKFRTHCNYSHHAYDDPIVYPNQPGASHLHTFFGNTEANAFSNYKSLRENGGSTCGGGKINRSAYWYPALLKDNALGDGKTRIIKPAYAVVYYNVGTAGKDQISYIPRGLSYVFGMNMNDPDDSSIKAELPPSYAYLGSGFHGWACENGGPLYPYLRNPDGSAAFDCPAGTRIKAALSSPSCWDGKNLTSPNGRMHVRQRVREGNSGQLACPKGWYKIATFDLIIVFDNPIGPSDYKDWYLASDRMDSTWTGSDCHGNGSGHAFCNGESMHSDWFGAWDWDIMTTWMIHCNGTTIPKGPDNPSGAPSDGHDCSDTIFGDGRKGLTGHPSPDTGLPVLNLSGWNETNRFDPMPVP